MQKNCPECGEPIKGRIDKKFCSDMCRNSHNNRANSDTTSYMRNVNNILRKNRRILEEIILKNGEKTSIPKSKLTDKGFRLDFHTNTLITKENSTYFFCYEFGIRPLENDRYLLVKRKEYLNE